jgi:hypothetical protein
LKFKKDQKKEKSARKSWMQLKKKKQEKALKNQKLHQPYFSEFMKSNIQAIEFE